METQLILRAMNYLQGHLDQFEVYGNDFPTADGTAVRDYIHVTDLAHAHVLALRIYCEAVPAARSIWAPAIPLAKC